MFLETNKTKPKKKKNSNVSKINAIDGQTKANS